MDKNLYFIAILPPPDIQEKVTDIKLSIRSKYKSAHALRSPPHITLHMPFKWREDKEASLIDFLKSFSSGKQTFSIELKNYNVFPPRVLYIDVIKNDNLNNLQKELTSEIKKSLNLFNANYKDRPFKPHMTVAHRDLSKTMFEEAWNVYQHERIACEFEVHSISLLKHDGKMWHEHQSFGF